MLLSLAPMEGLTGYAFRRIHAECFGPLDRYYTPFLSPRADSPFNKHDRKEIAPEHNEGLNVIPQILTKNPDDFVAAAERLAGLGYREVNLNLGCPSGTVASKGKGSGFLRYPEQLKLFLEDICERSPLPVSVKTRLGVLDDSEYPAILDMYCRLPLAELIVHPRVRKDFYRNAPRWEPYGLTLANAPFPVGYNGDIFAPAHFDALTKAYPDTRHVMLGRGILANPALARMLQGGPAASRAELQHFHDQLYQEYERIMGPNAVARMKEWWFYAKFAFANPTAVKRLIRKTGTTSEYEAAVLRVFCEQELAADGYFGYEAD